jgi:hypothetical protein
VRKQISRREEEDATSMGGWLFADSFLALMVIFLATISFVPSLGGAVSSTSNVGNIAGGSYIKGLNLVYEDFDPAVIRSDIQKFERAEKISLGSQVLYAKIVGGYDSKSEPANKGTFRALLYSARIKASDLSEFAEAKIDLGTSDKLSPTQIVLRLTLSGS